MPLIILISNDLSDTYRLSQCYLSFEGDSSYENHCLIWFYNNRLLRKMTTNVFLNIRLINPLLSFILLSILHDLYSPLLPSSPFHILTTILSNNFNKFLFVQFPKTQLCFSVLSKRTLPRPTADLPSPERLLGKARPSPYQPLLSLINLTPVVPTFPY